MLSQLSLIWNTSRHNPVPYNPILAAWDAILSEQMRHLAAGQARVVLHNSERLFVQAVCVWLAARAARTMK